jgi:hypothetical protein
LNDNVIEFIKALELKGGCMSERAKRIKYAMVIFAFAALLAFTGSAFAQCDPAYTYVALQTAFDAMNSDAQVTVTTRTVAGWSDPNYYYEFTPASGAPTEAFIIYPGACLDARAYAVVAHTIAASGYMVAIVPMPGYLAIFGKDRADAVINNHPEIETWSIGGHSFGGVGACWYVSGNYTYSNKINGIVLWAAYPDSAEPINTKPVKVISIWGTNDAYTTSAKIDASKPNLPADTRYIALQGGNHSQFGAYGFSATDYTFVQPSPAPGDNSAAISRQQQTDLIVQYTLSLLYSLTPGCGNGIIESGEQCESNSDCQNGQICNNCQCEDQPTLIELTRFDAQGAWRRVILNWITASEKDNAGFNIYRAETENGEYVKINAALIPAMGSVAQGAAYKFVDRSVERGKTYYYKLEDIDLSGIATLHGPANAMAKTLYMMMIGK